MEVKGSSFYNPNVKTKSVQGNKLFEDQQCGQVEGALDHKETCILLLALHELSMWPLTGYLTFLSLR